MDLEIKDKEKLRRQSGIFFCLERVFSYTCPFYVEKDRYFGLYLSFKVMYV